MRRAIWRSLAIAVCASMACLPVGAQQSSGNAVGQLMGSLIGPVFDILMAPTVTGEPYTATHVTSEQQKLQDGTTITRKGHHYMARDAEGRIRVEHTMGKGTANMPAMKMVYVKDPVAGTMTMWAEGGTGKDKTATVVKLPDIKKDASVTLGTPKPGTSKKASDSSTTEQLGQQSMDGVMVTGVRTTTVIPAGAVGNDQPITRTREIWTAPDLQLAVRQIYIDPRTGTRTVELENLSRENPPTTAFQPPPGYTVKDMDAVMKAAKDKAQAQP